MRFCRPRRASASISSNNSCIPSISNSEEWPLRLKRRRDLSMRNRAPATRVGPRPMRMNKSHHEGDGVLTVNSSSINLVTTAPPATKTILIPKAWMISRRRLESSPSSVRSAMARLARKTRLSRAVSPSRSTRKTHTSSVRATSPRRLSLSLSRQLETKIWGLCIRNGTIAVHRSIRTNHQKTLRVWSELVRKASANNSLSPAAKLLGARCSFANLSIYGLLLAGFRYGRRGRGRRPSRAQYIGPCLR